MVLFSIEHHARFYKTNVNIKLKKRQFVIEKRDFEFLDEF